MDFTFLKDTLITSMMKILSNYDIVMYSELESYIVTLGINIHQKLLNTNLEYSITNNIRNIINKEQHCKYIKNCNNVEDQYCINNECNNQNKLEMYNENKILDKLGEGGFGQVYKYYNYLDENHYALKRVEINGNINNFNEVKIMSKLNHKNIVKYNFCWYDDRIDTLNIQMELCDLSLSEYLYKRDNFNPSESYHITSEIMEGVEYLHNIGIIHGDLCGNNIFITSKFEIKIGDFGLSRFITHNNSIQHINNMYSISSEYGNPVYRAPEIYKYKICKASDIYSLGILFFEIFNKIKTLHQRKLMINKIREHKFTYNDISNIFILNPSILQKYSKLLLHMTNHNHKKRPHISYVKIYFSNLIYIHFNVQL